MSVMDQMRSGAADGACVRKNKIKVYRVSICVLAVLAALLRTLAVFISYDSGIGYFRSGAFLPATFNALAVCSVVWALSSLFLIPGGGLPRQPAMKTGLVYFSSVYAGFIMVAEAGYRVYENYISSSDLKGELGCLFGDQTIYGAADRTERIRFVITALCVLTALLTAVCFFRRAGGVFSRTASSVIFGMFPSFRAMCGLALIYFDMTVVMNSPDKMLLQAALSSVMIFFLLETRFCIGDDKALPLPYFAFGLVSLILCGSAGVSVVVGYYAGIIANGGLCLEAFFCLTAAFYVWGRLAAFERAVEGDENGLPADGASDDSAEDTAEDTAAEDAAGEANAPESGDVPENAGDDTSSSEA